MTIQSIKALIYKPGTILAIYIIAAIVAAVQLYSLGSHPFVMPKPGTFPDDIMNHPRYMNLFIGRRLTEYNNYLIFKYSYFHLIEGVNLYGIYPGRHWDFFKYSPTFAFLMGTIAYLPDVVGLSAWNILNAVAVFFAIRMLPLSVKTQCLLMWFIAYEMLTCLQNTQSNGLMCGLIIAAFGCMERGKILWATLWLMLATYIKVYGLIGCCIFLFYPGRLRFILYCIFWSILLAALPLLVTPPNVLVWQYQKWFELMIADASAARGLSVVGWLKSWFGIENSKTYVTIAGLILFMIPFARIKLYQNELFRLLILAFMLIWVIIFNHKAESSTFIIAVTGVGIWYFAMPAATWRKVLLGLVFVFTSLSTTDIFPPYVKFHFIYPYTIKVVPCIIVWCAVFFELMFLRDGKDQRMDSSLKHVIPVNGK